MPDRPLWWYRWLRWRQIDADRQWAKTRRGEQPPLLFSQLSRPEDREPWESRLAVPGFEEQTVAMMDARAALARLPRQTRLALLLHAAGYRGYEIATRLGVSAGRVSQILRRKRRCPLCGCALGHSGCGSELDCDR